MINRGVVLGYSFLASALQLRLSSPDVVQQVTPGDVNGPSPWCRSNTELNWCNQ